MATAVRDSLDERQRYYDSLRAENGQLSQLCQRRAAQLREHHAALFGRAGRATPRRQLVRRPVTAEPRGLSCCGQSLLLALDRLQHGLAQSVIGFHIGWNRQQILVDHRRRSRL